MTIPVWLEQTTRWYALLVLLTWGWAPLVRSICDHLADRGMFLARPLALVGVVYPVWLAASLGLAPYATPLLWLTFGLGSVVGWIVAWKHRMVSRDWLLTLATSEIVSLAAFVSYVWFRGFTPDILYTEKPMDSAFLASSAQTLVMPPVDPWFSGQPINYYYLGYLFQGTLARLAAITPTVAFNLALATTFSMTIAAAIGLGFNAARLGRHPTSRVPRRVAAVGAGLAAFYLAVAGNLLAPIQMIRHLPETVAASWWDTRVGIGWRASRIVCDGPREASGCRGPSVETINEFPFFSFLLGDLHPHLMALPLTVVSLGLAVNLLGLRPNEAGLAIADRVRIVVTGGIIGTLYGLNSWDFPTYLFLAALALWRSLDQLPSRRRLTAVATLGGAAILFWLPFVTQFVPPTGAHRALLPPFVRELPIVPGLLTSIAPHTGERTGLDEYLTMFGVQYGFGLLLIATGLVRYARASDLPAISRSVMVASVLMLVGAVLLPAPVLLLAGLPLVGALLLLRRDRTFSPRNIATTLFALGLALSLVVEFVYLVDAFTSRMNTLFKIYYQVWTLFAIVAALTPVVIWWELGPRWSPRLALVGTVGFAVVLGLAYPIVASRQWIEWASRQSGWSGLDGIAYIEEYDPAELAAIRWLQRNRLAEDVILEAPGCSYQPNGDIPFSRVSAYTGIPTIIGWGHSHETQWRAGEPALSAEISTREADAALLLGHPQGALLDHYQITLLFIGRYERDDWRHVCAVAGPFSAVDDPDYPGPGWELVFTEGEVRIYRRLATPAQVSP